MLRIPERLRRYASRKVACLPNRMLNEAPVVSFTFDDFPRSALVTGGGLLHERGLRGTYYASFGLMGKLTETGLIFAPQDLDLLLEQRHELGSHTFSHLHSWDTPADVFAADTIKNAAELGKLGTYPYRLRSFSFPLSCPHPFVKRALSGRFDSMRSGGQKINTKFVDLNMLGAFFIDQRNRDDADGLCQIIDLTCELNGWLIFATHDVEDVPTPFGIQPRILELLLSRCLQAGARILPVFEALQIVRPNRDTDSKKN